MDLDPQLASEVLTLVRERGLLQAILRLRQATGASLKEAHLTAFGIAKEAGILSDSSEVDMGMQAEVFAIGPFRKSLVGFMDYGEEFYAGVEEGTEVSVRIIHSLSGSGQSTDVANALGFAPWNFAAHAFDGKRADLQALRVALLRSFGEETDAAREEVDEIVEAFARFRDAGYRFYFRPNG